MALYEEEFSEGSQVRIGDLRQLQEFLSTWSYHHPLQPFQLEYASRVTAVDRVSFYHGGDVHYELRGVPGIWHECCLSAAATNK